MSATALTSLVKAGGCGSKIPPYLLHEALAQLPRPANPNLLFGTASGDDAGVYRLTDDLAIVQTVDFFTPIVDDPYDFGAIAAANALSDCYALGATPITGLNLVAFPCSQDMSLLDRILRGGGDKMEEAGAVILGGHSVNDSEPKYGIAITGTVHPKKMVLNTGARPGDVILITKKIGVGIIANLRKKGAADGATQLVSDAVYQEAVTSMKTLNKVASELMVEHGVNACTDITGFGFLGHAHNVALASGVSFEIWLDKVPTFAGVTEHAIEGSKGGGERNRRWIEKQVTVKVPDRDRAFAVLCDPQTSGPLLIAAAPDRAEKLIEKMNASKVLSPAVVGKVVAGSPGTLVVSSSAQ